MCVELHRINDMYEENLRSGNHRERTMLSLLWDLEELKQDGRNLRTELSIALDVVDMPIALRTHHNLPQEALTDPLCIPQKL